jgi:hypothetical protein
LRSALLSCEAFLHLLQQLGVIDAVGIVVLDVAVLVVGDDDAPAFGRHRVDAGGHDHAQALGAGRIAPGFQQARRVGCVQVAEIRRQVEGRDAAGQGDLALLRREEDGQPIPGRFLVRAGVVLGRRAGAAERQAEQEYEQAFLHDCPSVKEIHLTEKINQYIHQLSPSCRWRRPPMRLLRHAQQTVPSIAIFRFGPGIYHLLVRKTLTKSD